VQARVDQHIGAALPRRAHKPTSPAEAIGQTIEAETDVVVGIANSSLNSPPLENRV
jgi:hypothetical protein